MTRPQANASGPNASSELIAGVAIHRAAKVWWPDDGITKGDVARYYHRIARYILPWMADRPLVAERCPDGMLGTCFVQKNFPGELPADVPRVPIVAQSTGRTVDYVVGGAEDTLLSLVDLGCIAVHVMNSRRRTLQHPDWLAFDLDPGSGEFRDAANAGRHLKRILDSLALRSYPKTSGARGLHVLVPLHHDAGQDEVREFAQAVGRMLAQQAPDLVTVETRKQQRADRVFADAQRNAFGQTIAAPYSVRRRPKAAVSTPLDWDEVSPLLDPASFNLKTMERRLAAHDPWRHFWERTQVLPKMAG